MVKAIFKIIVVIIAVLLLLQLEYNGRRLHTYVTEYFKSLKGEKQTVYIEEDEKPAESQKVLKGKEPAPVEKKVKIIKQKADDQADISDRDRKELENILD